MIHWAWTLSFVIIIFAIAIIGTLALAARQKYTQCRITDKFWCWNDWVCPNVAKCTQQQEAAGDTKTCFSAKAVYSSFLNNCNLSGNNPPPETCKCAWQETPFAGLCNNTRYS